jgi:hypothetical protein
MLTVTLVAVVLGAFRVAPGLGILLVVVVSPAWLRTCLNVMRRKARGRPMSATEKLGLFAGSLGVVTVVGVAAGVAFYATCWAGFGLGAAASGVAHTRGGPDYTWVIWGMFAGVSLGIVAALVVGVFLLRRLWPHKQRRAKLPGDAAGPD